MAVTHPPVAVPRLRGATVSTIPLGERLPLLVSAALLVGLAVVVVATPIGSGDFGQWLMTSRFYLGERIPDYRVIGDVPVVVPALLAALQVVVRDPLTALHLMAALLLVGVGAAFHLCGRLVLGTHWAGTATLVVGLLVTDRFTELFAFGGLLQAAAVAFLVLSIGAFVGAGREESGRRGWWWLAVGSLWLAALSHVGTGLVAVPVGMAAALLAFRPLRGDARRDLRRLRWPAAGLAVLAAYWLLLAFSAGGEYVSNPASLGYRGPDRLLELLMGQWPTALIIVTGVVAIVLGTVRAAVLRRLDGFPYLAAWAVLSWSMLGYLVVGGSATDYPRFATPLLAPLVVGAAAGLLWGLRSFATYVHGLGLRAPGESVLGVGVVALILVIGPLAADRQGRQAAFYQVRDADALAAAAAWLDTTLGDPGDVILADTREAKWIEGLTGRAALFSQPVRYAFRPIEWERSVAADALLRSTDMITSGLVTARYTSLASAGAVAVPADLLLSVNHRGEFVDVLRIPAAATELLAADVAVAAADLAPVDVTSTSTDATTSLQTRWGADAQPSLAQRLTAWRDGSALSLVQQADGYRLATRLLPVGGMAITSLEMEAGEAVACFTEIGNAAPCVRIHVSQADATLSATSDGGILIATRQSGRLDLQITALTAGDPSVPLGLLHPSQLADAYRIGAALLNATDPAYRERATRLAAIGFVEAASFGPYRVLLREGGES
jgi:hypothetical protein